MIDKREILEAASALGLLPNIVEKDYVLGWLLAGIFAHPELVDSWVFKGGTCLKKCYFETYRFSEDLDFTLRDEAHLNEDFLRRTLGEVADWVADQSGLVVPKEQLAFDIYNNPRGRISCQGKVGYRGPVSPTATAGGWPKIKLDLTADEKLVLPSVRRDVFHPYADRSGDGFEINAYSYEEAFGEKMRALGERTRPRDLYDVVNLYRHRDTRPPAAVLRDVLAQKCAYKGIEVPTITALEEHRADMESMWGTMLAHQLPVLPPVADFWAVLPEVFDWLSGSTEAPNHARIDPRTDEVSVRSRVLPMGIPVRTRAPLEIIRFAAANHLCIDLHYQGSVRRIEPYSLRRTSQGNYVLHAVKFETGEARSYRVDRIEGAEVTQQTFSPRYLVELTTEGPLVIPESAVGIGISGSSGWGPPARRPVQRSAWSNSGPTYIYRCPFCEKLFRRKTMDPKLNPHKTSDGWDCPGRLGTYEDTRY
jgi:predicted nucleotidyltransferase component of viral defense system